MSSFTVTGPDHGPPVGGQEWFELSLCRTAVSAGWSWNRLEDPEFALLIRGLRPDLKIPDRRVVAGPILDTEVNRVVGDLKDLVEGHPATGMRDGWKNVPKDSVIASMITVNYQVCDKYAIAIL